MNRTLPAYGWLDGTLVPWDECVLHARSAGALWGATVFEGIRSYSSARQQDCALFRLDDHLSRLHRSARGAGLSVAYSDAELAGACAQLLRANGFTGDAHLTATVYAGLSDSLDPMDPGTPCGVHITAIATPPSRRDGVDVCVSSWRRINSDSMPPLIKAGGNYQNSRLAQSEAQRNGYDTALLVNNRGTVAEGPGSCFAALIDGELVSPPVTAGALDGITLDSICQLARTEFGVPVVRREVDRGELYGVQEAFLSGTMHGVMPIKSVDRVPVGDGKPGPLTEKLATLYEQAVRDHPAYGHWRTPLAELAPPVPVSAGEAR
jgi:branched-chain amino acid aminotransferase